MKIIIPHKRKKVKFRSKSKKAFFFKLKKKTKFLEKTLHRNILFGIIFLIIIIIGINILFKKTFLSPKYNILLTTFTFKTISKIEDPELIKFIKKELIGQNYFIVKYVNKGKILGEIKNKYKFIKNWDLFMITDNKIAIDISFHDPKIIFQDNLGYRGVYQGQFFEIFSGSQLLSGKLLINLPNYTTKYKIMSGFFYQISEEKLVFQINEISNFIGIENINNIEYLPGGSKTIVKLVNGIKLYLSNDKNISDQIKNYLMLRKNYNDFDKISEIDLGSINDPIIKLGK